jgi:hypothetical protein
MHKIGDIFKVENADLNGKPDWFIITIILKDTYKIRWFSSKYSGGEIGFNDLKKISKNRYELFNHMSPTIKLSEKEILQFKIKYSL